MKLSFLMRNLSLLLFKGEIHFQFDRIPMVARNVTGKKRWNLLKIGLNRLFPIARTMGRPYMAHVSPSGLCDLSCVNCPAGNPEFNGRTLLGLDTFKKFVDEAGDTLLYIILWSWGEPLLNKDLPKMAAYAREKGILTVSSTNLNRLTPELAAELVTDGPDALIIALDGTTPESHEKYREGSDYNQIIYNTKMLVRMKEEKHSARPLLNLRMVVSSENEDQMDDFRELGRYLGVDMVSFKAFSTRQSGEEDPEIDKRFAPKSEKLRWYEYRPGFRANRKRDLYWCRFPWTKPMLFADGMVISCEFDLKYEAAFGNINEKSFDEIWFSREAEAFRRAFQKNRNQFAFCRNCVFDYTTFDGCVLEAEMTRRDG